MFSSGRTQATALVLALFVLGLLRSRVRSRVKARKRLPFVSPEDVGARVPLKQQQSDDAPEYDIVIVGGGAAGCVLAARLSEDPSLRVLLLEAGGSSRDEKLVRAPAAFSELFHTKYDWNLYTTPQAHAGGRKLYWPRGKMLGGCSSMNAMMCQKGTPYDYDNWARILKEEKLEGAEEWEFRHFKKYLLKFENFVPSERFPVDLSHHGQHGPMEIGFSYFSRFSEAWIDTCAAIGIPRIQDFNTPAGTLGVAKIMTYIGRDGQRTSTEKAYLTPEVLARPNLTVATHAHVTRLLFDFDFGPHGSFSNENQDVLDDAGKREPRVEGVEFARDRQGPRFRVRARREVVLSAGAVHSPQILLLSGIGPKDAVNAANLRHIVDLPGVGQHLRDHMTVCAVFKLKESSTYVKSEAMNKPRTPLSLSYLPRRTFIDRLRYMKSVMQWILYKNGPITSNFAEAAAFIRVDQFCENDVGEEKAERTSDIEDHISGLDAPDIELFVTPCAWRELNCKHPDLPLGDLGMLTATILRPTSAGSITIRTADPFEAPVVNPNILSTEHDVALLTKGLRLCLRIAQTQPLASFIDTNADAPAPRKPSTTLSVGASLPVLDHNLHTQSDEMLKCAVHARAETLFHPTSTVRMGARDAGGCVDLALRVYGVRGLRVADASVFPEIISGHTTAPTIAVAEKAADLIKHAMKQPL